MPLVGFDQPGIDSYTGCASARIRRSAGNSVSVPCRVLIAGAQLHLRQSVQHVEFRERQRVETIDPRRIADDHRVVPAAAPWPSRRRAVLLAAFAQAVGQRSLELGRQRPLPNPGGVRLCHSEHAAYRARRNAETRADAAHRRVRRGDERIRAVIDVEQRRLRTLEHHRLRPSRIICASTSDTSTTHGRIRSPNATSCSIERLPVERGVLDDAVTRADVFAHFGRQRVRSPSRSQMRIPRRPILSCTRARCRATSCRSCVHRAWPRTARRARGGTEESRAPSR